MNESESAELVTVQVPMELVKLLRRLAALKSGRVLLVLTKENDRVIDWSLLGEGKVERPMP